MAVRIRLTRIGATKRPAYRVVAIDSRRARDGRPLEILGHYDPLTEPATVQLDEARIRDWMSKGAQPSETVVKLLKQAGAKTGAEEAAAAEPARKPRARRAKTAKAVETEKAAE